MAEIDDAIEQLHTVRDWVRYAHSRFQRAGLHYGHGTSDALDEAAFLVLESLRLPVEDVNPWADARLLMSERQRIAKLIESRIATRKPAAYLVGAAYIQGHRFIVDERVIVPRSYLGELLLEGDIAGLLDGAEPERVLELCTGSAALAILAARVFASATVDAVDIDAAALDVARANVELHHMQDRVRLLHGDLFQPAADGRYDLILANPPYVARAEMAAFPPEHRAEPAIAHDGGDDGLDLVRAILDQAASHLTDDGLLVMEIGTGREQLLAGRPMLEALWLDTAASEGEVLAIRRRDLVTAREPARKGRTARQR